MAQFLDATYSEVALAAIIPAFLFYAGLFMQVDLYAALRSLKGLERHELPSAWYTFKEGWYYACALYHSITTTGDTTLLASGRFTKFVLGAASSYALPSNGLGGGPQ